MVFSGGRTAARRSGRWRRSGRSIKEITRSTGRSRKLVGSVLRSGDGDVFRLCALPRLNCSRV